MCQKPIGYAPKPYDDGGCKEHGMVLREGHYRIFKNEDVKYSQMSRYKENDNKTKNIKNLNKEIKLLGRTKNNSLNNINIDKKNTINLKSNYSKNRTKSIR